jgi:uncharacterized protein (DUF1697 family)
MNVLVNKLENVKILLTFGAVITRLSESTIHTGCHRLKNHIRYSNFYKLDKAKWNRILAHNNFCCLSDTNEEKTSVTFTAGSLDAESTAE